MFICFKHLQHVWPNCLSGLLKHWFYWVRNLDVIRSVWNVKIPCCPTTHSLALSSKKDRIIFVKDSITENSVHLLNILLGFYQKISSSSLAMRWFFSTRPPGFLGTMTSLPVRFSCTPCVGGMWTFFCNYPILWNYT